ncbi:hypothetical protein PIB30_075456 [Stylosanthes scabra]|uniref:Uncharacterized protein n=1 Tax=Stylosanthes scabra TaxID=79078 RepID=A0ABU6QQE7_9FABA|nr:hypothetical protein [Stylosanthes scabra]
MYTTLSSCDLVVSMLKLMHVNLCDMYIVSPSLAGFFLFESCLSAWIKDHGAASAKPFHYVYKYSNIPRTVTCFAPDTNIGTF